MQSPSALFSKLPCDRLTGSSAFRKLLTLILMATAAVCMKAQAPHGPQGLPPGPMLNGGKITLRSSSLMVDILKYSGTVARLSPVSDANVDYTPGDRLKERSADTFYHLGDLDLRFRTAGSPGWTDVSTAFHREQATVLKSEANLFTEDVSSSIPSSTPLKLVRTWAVENGDLVLRFTVTNRGSVPLEIGGAGISMVFNNIMNGLTLDQSYRRLLVL